MDKSLCTSLLTSFTSLLISKNFDDTLFGSTLEAQSDFIKAVKARIDQVSYRKMLEWQESYSRFCMFMDDHYLRVKRTWESTKGAVEEMSDPK